MENEKGKLFLRSLPASVEVREKDGGEKSIAGVIPYDKNSEDLGGFIEVIRKGAFDRSLKDGDVRCLWGHNTQYVLGRSGAKTLALESRDDGLHFECSLPDAGWANDLYGSVKRGDVPGVSFGFYVVRDSWTRGKNEPALRELLDVDLLEVSVGVAFPAYPDASAGTRALLETAGINAGGLEAALRKQSDCMNEEDVRAIRSAIASLEKLIPAPKQEPDALAARDNRARELDLLEAEGFDKGDSDYGV